MTSVLFLTDRGRFHQSAVLAAAPAGLAITMLRAPPADELAAAMASADVVISERNQPVPIAAASPRLRLIVRLGSLLEGIDVDAAQAAGVAVSAQPVLSSIHAAEHVIMMTLALGRRLGRALGDMEAPRASVAAARRTDEDTFAYNWHDYPDLGSLHGATVAILGMGEIGVEVVRRLRPFGPRAVLYHKRRRFPDAVEAALGIAWQAPELCARAADVLVSLLPYALGNDRAVGPALLGAMKPRGLLVHAGSGAVIDEPALIEALQARRIGGAALDTYEHEPLPADHPLRALAADRASNLLLTPHIASGAVGDRSEDWAEVVRFLEGRPLAHRVVAVSPVSI